ncbi:hypothetical protein ACFS6H_18010 [Terrimonas rubra]|uniref:Lipoprotein n=1 Tax=Terrimonas rubra TaxID=1035890 RepID=A0ABW6A8B8_9BACT
MKKILSVLAIALLTVSLFTSCKKDDDPADNDLFVGTYRGSVSYNTDGETISKDNGSVTVVKIGSKYNFAFSDGIPDITGVEFAKENDNTYINIGGDATSYIRINASTLKILYVKDGKRWGADCTR